VDEEFEIEGPDEVDLYSERHYVREAAKVKPSYPGRTYNSEESISGFFGRRGAATPGRGVVASRGFEAPPARSPSAGPPKAKTAPAAAGRPRSGSSVEHPKYGRGTILRREGEGEDAKLTVMFPGHGLKKLVAKYAQLKNDE
jgi:DNA helicase-2/ATP-dependent DNA helicase PcrA